jgi:hypothetical protein
MFEKVQSGRNTYGKIIGIIIGERTFPRIPGDMGNATTFEFPVRLHVVKDIDVSTRLKLFSGSAEFIKPFVQAAKQLEGQVLKLLLQIVDLLFNIKVLFQIL